METNNLLSFPGITYTRTGNATAWRKDGTLAQFAPNVPRITDAGVTIERHRTNLLTHWNPTAAQIVTKDGCTDAAAPTVAPLIGRNWVALDNAVATAFAYIYTSGATTPAGSVVTLTVFVETQDGSKPVFGGETDPSADFTVRNLPSGLALLDTAAKYTKRAGNVWEVSITGTTNTTGSLTAIGVLRYGTHNKRPLKFSGFQLEQASTPSTPIITTGAAATVGVDNLALGGLGSVLAAPFSVVCEVAGIPVVPATFPTPFAITSGSLANRVSLFRSGNDGRLYAQVRANSAQVALGSILASSAWSGPIKMAVSFNGSSLRWAANGQVGPSLSVAIAFSLPLNTLAVGSSGGGGDYISDVGRSTTLFPFALTDAELVELTR